MILPILITAGVVGTLLYTAPLFALRDRGSMPPMPPEPGPPEPVPPPPPPPVPRERRPFEGLPYGSVVRVQPDGIIFGPGGEISDVVKIVGEAGPPDYFGYRYLAIDTRCRWPDNWCSRYTLREDKIAERLS